MNILGLTGGFHFGSCDASATIISNGIVLASIEEERLSRVKNSFAIPPTRCIKSALEIANISIREIDYVGIYVKSYPESVREIKEHIISLFGYCPPIEPIHHHQCHAASSFYASKFNEAAVVTFDWSGDGVSSSIWYGKGDSLEKLLFIERPNSLGTFYAAFTQFLGFERGDEYKVMGLASYGNPKINLDSVLNVSNPIYELNRDIINKKNRNLHQLVINEEIYKLFPDFSRYRYSPLEQKHMDMAASVQLYFEKATSNLVRYAIDKTGCRNICLAGGGGLNCTANGKLLNDELVNEVYVPPFPNDTGCSYGAAACIAINNGDKIEPLNSAQLGPSFNNEEIQQDLKLLKCKATFEENIEDVVASEIVNSKLVGWFQGGLEVGPRALGGRSILADPRDKSVKDRINKYVKFRESFRPFAPSVKLDKVNDYFELAQPSPYMNFIAKVKIPNELPGITHVDGTARIQTVTDENAKYHRLLNSLEEKTGYAAVLNTSFNYMGQPIVCSPKEAIYTFFGTGLDTLAIGNWLIRK